MTGKQRPVRKATFKFIENRKAAEADRLTSVAALSASTK
jgi:hypothetical protein